MDKVAFYTLGCKVNQYETEAMIDLFKEANYEIVEFDRKADYYIINSCTVTNQAASKSRKKARRAKRRNPKAKVVMVGCYSQAFSKEVAEIEEVDYIIGSSGKKDIVNLLEKSEKTEDDNDFISEIKDFKNIKSYEDMSVKEINQTTRANIKIEDGCNQFCSYCIIPYARGPVKSRKMESVLMEVKKLVDKGIKEIVLTGTHLGNYGLDKKNKHLLSNLVEKIIKINGNFRIRLSSIEVTEIDDKLISLLKEKNKLTPHLHLPLQSGSNVILNAMNRPYTCEDFANTVNKLKNKVEDIAITTDIIVGFPGESDKDFQRTYNFIKKMKFSRLHVFPFSERGGTPAARMKAKIHSSIKKKRSLELIELNKKLMKNYHENFFNKKREVVIENSRDSESNFLKGITDNYIHVLIDAKDFYKNKLVKAKLLKNYDDENVIASID
ncbi:MAG: tRNA (N(6)-L-threonylcarbamoyladenosine(37)-C(2))-methylthiotransferase MtaB [Bacillota bacterium]